jgi:proline dehydrogenase
VPLRSTILYLSRQKALRDLVERSSLAKRFSSRFVAGHSLEEAIAVCSRIHSEGIATTLDYLGENVKSLEEAAACRDMYLRTLCALQRAGIEPNVSLKLTQFGLDLSATACEANVGALVQAAAAMGGFVRIDMESSQYTDRTLGLVRRLHEKHKACGTVIQAYLHRSAQDIQALNMAQIRVRLCKGAYLEKPDVAFPAKADVDRNYLDLARLLLTSGKYPAIATHDERIILAVERFVREKGMARDGFEFQMLYGIRRDLQKRLISVGYRLRLYVPFGEAWYPYFVRRLAERPANLLFFLRQAFRA